VTQFERKVAESSERRRCHLEATSQKPCGGGKGECCYAIESGIDRQVDVIDGGVEGGNNRLTEGRSVFRRVAWGPKLRGTFLEPAPFLLNYEPTTVGLCAQGILVTNKILNL
jgi:hypothetical protein